MLLSVVAIGNSKGIRIPKAILEQCNIRDRLELEVDGGRIILEAVGETPRKDWEKKFQEMATNKDDNLLVADEIGIDMEEWEW